MPTAPTDSHVPRRPDWTCLGCGHPWPCHTYRTAALAEQPAGADADRLTARMGGHLAVAKWDLRDVPLAELEDRFVSWAAGRGR